MRNELIYLYELQPRYDNRKSFYGKAKVFKDNEGNILLMSYTTIVAQIKDKLVTETGETELNVFGWYSATTARHINEFLQQYGFDKMTKKDMEGGE